MPDTTCPRAPVPGERPPSSMVPSILISAARGAKLVIGGAGGELIISAVVQVSRGGRGLVTVEASGGRGWGGGGTWCCCLPCFSGSGWHGGGALCPPCLLPFPTSPVPPHQAVMNKLWLGLDLSEAIAAPILHVGSQGRVEFEPNFSQVRLWSACPWAGANAGGSPLPKATALLQSPWKDSNFP